MERLPIPEAHDERELRSKAREAILSGKVPSSPPQETWGGPGSGDECSICGKPLRAEQIELELSFLSEAEDRSTHGNAEKRSYRLHIRCWTAWEAERRAESGLQASIEP